MRGERQPGPLEQKITCNFWKTFKSGVFHCNSSSAVFNCEMDQLIGWCLVSTLFLWLFTFGCIFKIFSQGAAFFKILIKTCSFGGPGSAHRKKVQSLLGRGQVPGFPEFLGMFQFCHSLWKNLEQATDLELLCLFPSHCKWKNICPPKKTGELFMNKEDEYKVHGKI